MYTNPVPPVIVAPMDGPKLFGPDGRRVDGEQLRRKLAKRERPVMPPNIEIRDPRGGRAVLIAIVVAASVSIGGLLLLLLWSLLESVL